MSSSPRTRPSTVALTAIAIGVLVIAAVLVAIAVGIDVIKYGETFVTGLYPPQAVTSQGAAIRDLYTIVFLVAVAIFFVVEGLILWSVIRYHRKPGDDSLPPQTHGNNIAEAVWTIVPTLIVAFLFVISWQTLNVVDAKSATPETRINARAGQFQWSFDYIGDDGKIVFTQLVPTGPDGGLNVPTGRTIRLFLTVAEIGRHPRVLRAPVPIQAGRHPWPDQLVRVQRGRRPGRPDVPRPMRRAVRIRPLDHALRRPRHEGRRLRYLAGDQGRRRGTEPGGIEPGGIAVREPRAMTTAFVCTRIR